MSRHRLGKMQHRSRFGEKILEVDDVAACLDKFDRAEERDLVAAAERTRNYLDARSGTPPQALVSSATALLGRQIAWRTPALGLPIDGIRIESSAGRRAAVFAVAAPSGLTLGEIVVSGSSPLFEAGTLAVRIFVVGLALAGGLMLLIMLLVVDRTIVGRIQLLADKVEHEKDSERLPVKLDYPGDDELAVLARSIEELALLVQQAEREYRHVVEDQTESICRFDGEGRITFSNKAFEGLCSTRPAGKRPALASCLSSGVRTSVEQALAELKREAPITQFTHAVPGDRW